MTSRKYYNPDFSGKKKDYPPWRMKLQAYAAEEGFALALLTAFKSQLPSREDTVLDENTADGKAHAEAKALNAKAYNALILGMKDNKMLNVLQQSKTEAWPSGLAWLAIELLEQRFAPKDAMSSVEMEDQLAKIKIGKNDDPLDIDDKMAEVQIQFGCVLTEDQKLTWIIKIARGNYASEITNCTKLYNMVHGRKPTPQEMLDTLHECWRVGGGKKSDNDDSTETVLAAPDGFAGTCYHCKQKGHKANNPKCPKFNNNGGGNGSGGGGSNNNGKKKFDKDCNNCGVKGHKKVDCWELESNAHKRPKNWKSKMSNNNTGATSIEMVIAHVEVPVEVPGEIYCNECEFQLTSVGGAEAIARGAFDDEDTKTSDNNDGAVKAPSFQEPSDEVAEESKEALSLDVNWSTRRPVRSSVLAEWQARLQADLAMFPDLAMFRPAAMGINMAPASGVLSNVGTGGDEESSTASGPPELLYGDELSSVRSDRSSQSENSQQEGSAHRNWEDNFHPLDFESESEYSEYTLSSETATTVSVTSFENSEDASLDDERSASSGDTVVWKEHPSISGMWTGRGCVQTFQYGHDSATCMKVRKTWDWDKMDTLAKVKWITDRMPSWLKNDKELWHMQVDYLLRLPPGCVNEDIRKQSEYRMYRLYCGKQANFGQARL